MCLKYLTQLSLQYHSFLFEATYFSRICLLNTSNDPTSSLDWMRCSIRSFSKLTNMSLVTKLRLQYTQMSKLWLVLCSWCLLILRRVGDWCITTMGSQFTIKTSCIKYYVKNQVIPPWETERLHQSVDIWIDIQVLNGKGGKKHLKKKPNLSIRVKYKVWKICLLTASHPV